MLSGGLHLNHQPFKLHCGSFFILAKTHSQNEEIVQVALSDFLSFFTVLQPLAPCVHRGPVSSHRRRTARCHCTRLPSWSAWQPAIPHLSSLGAEPTASPSTFTTPKCWETETSSSQTSSASTAASTCAGPPPLARGTTP